MTDSSWRTPERPSGGRRIVVAADADAVTRAITARMLDEDGWVVVRTSDVSSTLAACRDRVAAPAAVVLDEHLPSMSALVSRLEHERPDLPIVVASRSPIEWRETAAERRRAPVFLEKPYGPRALAASLAAATSPAVAAR